MYNVTITITLLNTALLVSMLSKCFNVFIVFTCIVLRAKWQKSVIPQNLLLSINKVIIIIIIFIIIFIIIIMGQLQQG